jgi:hypothetical protein
LDSGFRPTAVRIVWISCNRGEFVTRALRSNSLWLVVTYVGLILLMARAYA